MAKYVCPVCGYVYDETNGDDENAPGTTWVNVSDDYVCPLCGVEKSSFEAE